MRMGGVGAQKSPEGVSFRALIEASLMRRY